MMATEREKKVHRQKCDELRSRLDRGWIMCDNSPDDKRLEQHFLTLLAEYQEACKMAYYSGIKIGTL